MEEIKKPNERLIDKTKTHKNPWFNLDLELIKETYGKKRFNELMSLVNKHDPLKFIPLGASLNVYCYEVGSIIIQLDNLTTKEETSILANIEFDRRSGDLSIEEMLSIEKMAEDIFNWKMQNGDRDLAAEYCYTAEMCLKEKTEESNQMSLFFLSLALLVDEDDHEIEKRVNDLESQQHGNDNFVLKTFERKKYD